MSSKNYVDIVYNTDERPFTGYPDQLTKYLADRFKMRPSQKILDFGCGRGEFSNGFAKCGLDVFAVDQTDCVSQHYPEIQFKPCDLIDEGFPFEDNTFDFVYSKSVIEHFYYPEKVMKEIYRVLKPGGVVVTLTPDWEIIYKMFYEDFTHRTPFTLTSLRDINLITGFQDIEVEKFIQLPSVWRSKSMKCVSQLTAMITPDFLKSKSKWVRFSKEMMLLSCGTKPNV